ncbi:MAG: DNA primase [Armatimonadetes bacterium]|nr:DNA primase [Armatimonadota bacterium]NOG93925.1 DNA primase [Armatimonadota bacterium]
MPDELDAIRSRVDIVELISERVRLSRSGQNWKGLCPFHTEKTPSFFVSPSRQRYHCFGCQAKGDIFNWVMALENTDFRGALEKLAARAGVELGTTAPQAKGDAERLIQVNEEASLFFRSQLESAAPARQYLERRGISADQISTWEIGYAPAIGEALVAHLRRKGIRLYDANSAGLVSGDDRAGWVDFFIDRITFPIRDERGRLVAFGGRSLGSQEPKYKNTRETQLFNKSATLYGLHQSLKALRDQRRVLLVEGYLDVVACHKAGLATAVATLGTALGQRHATLLRRYADSAVIAYDGDTAGRNAATRAAEVLENAGIACTIAEFDPEDDPASFVQRGDAARLVRHVEDAMSPLRFQIRSRVASLPSGSSPPDSFWRGAIELLAVAQDQVEADRVLDELAGLHPRGNSDKHRTRKQLEIMLANAQRRFMKGIRHDLGESAAAKALEPPKFELPSREERFILRSVLDPDLRPAAWEFLCDSSLFESEPGTRIRDSLLNHWATMPVGAADQLLQELDPEIRYAFDTMEAGIDGPVTPATLELAVERIRAQNEKKRRDEIIYRRQVLNEPHDSRGGA